MERSAAAPGPREQRKSARQVVTQHPPPRCAPLHSLKKPEIAALTREPLAPRLEGLLVEAPRHRAQVREHRAVGDKGEVEGEVAVGVVLMV